MRRLDEPSQSGADQPGGSGPRNPVAKPQWRREMIDEISEELKSAFQRSGVCAAYVFGSLARGREADRTAISDLDIAVVIPPPASKQAIKDAWYALRESLEHIFKREDFDLVVANEASAALRFRIVRERDIIYCADEAALVWFEAETRRDWNDMQYFRHLQRLALEERYGTH